MPTPKTSMRGIVHQVGDIEWTGERNDFPRQRILLYCPAQRDQHTQKPFGKDEFFQLDILGKKVEELHIHEGYHNKVVEVEIRFNGNCYNKKDNTGRGYAINCNLVNMKIITDASTDYTQAAVDLAMGY